MRRPPFGSPEWLANFEEIVRTSKRATEAATKLGYRGPGVVRYHMKRLGIPYPREWSQRPVVSLFMQRNIPSVVIPTTVGRCWVAGLVQGEACIQSLYRLATEATYLQLDVSMVDPAPIYELSEYYGLPHSMRATKNHDWRLQWRKNISGLRAFRVLSEILPFLVGQKLREAEKALTFFGPRGIHHGCYRNGDIWPQSEFPLRTKHRGSNALPTNEGDAQEMPNLRFNLGRLPANSPDIHVVPDVAIPTIEEYGPNQRKVPEVIIKSWEGRAWVGGLNQGEGCTGSHFVDRSDSTTVDISLAMTDFAPVYRFSQFVGLAPPVRPRMRADRKLKPLWRKEFTGLRALRVLREILPFTVGEKAREIERALEFFGPTGTRRGCFRPVHIWPPDEFPLRRRLVRYLGHER
jgi:hypothetical protein